jgi:ABC-type bacteriocin/lantibiotic exporter with double-glycine peptidase domain
MVTESIYSISHQDLTIIIVAHRLETLKYCDRIYKIEKGKIALKN